MRRTSLRLSSDGLLTSGLKSADPVLGAPFPVAAGFASKTNVDIGDILGSSPRPVQKHMGHVFEKLGVETRTAAAAMEMAKVPLLNAGR